MLGHIANNNLVHIRWYSIVMEYESRQVKLTEKGIHSLRFSEALPDQRPGFI